jgi:prepilin-type N-terminal cleavage/methylation domain-containing protein
MKHSRPGFTLAEMAISMFVVSVIAMAVGASVTVLFREAEANRNFMASTSGGAASASAQANAARSALDMLGADMKVATGIIDLPGANGGFTMLLTVPPRYTGHSNEALTYQWAGPGTSLTRQLNGGASVSIADNVQSLNLSNLTTAAGPTMPSGVVAWHDGGAESNVTGMAITSTSWPCQFLLPPLALPQHVSSWSISHLKLQLQGTGTGTIAVQVYSANSAQHPVTLLDSASVSASTLPTKTSQPGWTDVTFTKLTSLGSAGVCIVVSTTASVTPASVWYDTTASGSNMAFSATSNGGSSWSTASTPPALQMQVYGTVVMGP